MKFALPLLAGTLVVCACTPAANDDGKPSAQMTLPPAAAFKDALLVASIKAQLAADDLDSASHVHVIVHDGVATLSGSARSAAQRAKDVGIVSKVKGIARVEDRLDIVASGGSKSAADLGLAAQVTGAIAAQTGVNALDVKVSALSGTVTIAGKVPSAAIKATMLAAAKSVSGVRNVDDQIAVR